MTPEFDIPSWKSLETATNELPPEQEELVRSYVRAFSTNDGARVLAELRRRFLDGRLGPTMPDAHLRHAEGCREVVDHIISTIKRGQQK